MHGLGLLPKNCSGQVSLGTAIRFFTNHAAFNLQDLSMNCSQLCMTDLTYGYTREKDFLSLLSKAVDWMLRAGYTKIFVTMSNEYPRKLKFLHETGFTNLGRPYRSRRTTNTIYWLQGDLLKLQAKLKGLK